VPSRLSTSKQLNGATAASSAAVLRTDKNGGAEELSGTGKNGTTFIINEGGPRGTAEFVRTHEKLELVYFQTTF
jgi:hypothetical protein